MRGRWSIASPSSQLRPPVSLRVNRVHGAKSTAETLAAVARPMNWIVRQKGCSTVNTPFSCGVTADGVEFGQGPLPDERLVPPGGHVRAVSGLGLGQEPPLATCPYPNEAHLRRRGERSLAQPTLFACFWGVSTRCRPLCSRWSRLAQLSHALAAARGCGTTEATLARNS